MHVSCVECVFLIQYSRNNNCLKLFDGDESKPVSPPSSELYQVALMRESLGLQPISSTQVVKLETENRDLTAKLRKTRIMLNDNTTRSRGSTATFQPLVKTTPAIIPGIFKFGLKVRVFFSAK